MSTLARRIVAVCLLAALACGAKATTAAAGTYPMSQCQALPSRPVAAGWASYGPGGMFNACGGDNGFGLWIGEMPYNSTAGLTIGIPSSRPHVAIERVDAGMNVTHERDQYSFLRWLAGGQTLYDREMTGWAESRITRTPAQGTREFTMDVVCTTGNGPTNCRFEDLRRVVVISWLVFTLAESDNPTAQATGGSLLAGGPHRGTESLSWTASDEDSGVRSVEVRLGRTPLLSYAFDAAGACAYDSWNACPNTQSSASADVDTTKVPDGTYPLRLVVTDAANNTSMVDAGPVTIDNVGAAASTRAAADRSVASDCNGSVCPDRAQLTAAFRDNSSQMRVRYGRPATISGRLTTLSGEPIAGAKLDVSSIAIGPGGPDGALGQVATDSQGRWSYDVPAGPSRIVRFAWRARVGASSYAERSDVRLLVLPRVSVRSKSRTIHRGGRVTLSGSVVGGPYPAAGVLVTLQGRPSKGGRWRTFGVTRTRGAHGRFRRFYRFQAASRGRFLFRARVAVQAGYPYLAAGSRVARALVRG